MQNSKQKLRRQTTQQVAQNFQDFEKLTDSEAEKVTGGLTFEFGIFEFTTKLLEFEFGGDE
jgi:hypothetical protein